MSATLLADHRKPALLLPEQTLSYSQLLGMAHGYGCFIPEESQRVLIFSENRSEWVYALYAAWGSGCTVVPVDYQSTADELAFIVGDCRPSVLFCSLERKPVVEEVLAQLDYQLQLLVFEALPPFEQQPEEAIEAADPERTALLIYTSGTTGNPKGVMLSFANLLANVEAVTLGTPIYNPEERIMMLLPLTPYLSPDGYVDHSPARSGPQWRSAQPSWLLT